MSKRPYSTAFPRHANSKAYALQGIPPALLRAARAKARREHMSLRLVLLTLLTNWTDPTAPAVGTTANTWLTPALGHVRVLASYECAEVDGRWPCGACGPCEARAFLLKYHEETR